MRNFALPSAHSHQLIPGENEVIDPQQMAACDLLTGKIGMSPDEATAYVQHIGVGGSITLKILLQKSPDPVRHFRDFEATRNERMQ